MIKINWNQFKIKNSNHQEAFEDLSYFLFCRKFRKNDGIFRYKNQTGIETEPILEKGKIIGFQVKWFDWKIDKNNIIDSIIKAKNKNPKLNKIIFYINQEFSESRLKTKKDGLLKSCIERYAKKSKIEIEWIVPSNFKQILTQPSNLDLMQLYFDLSDEFGFINSCTNSKILTFLQSSEYIEIPFINSKTNKLPNTILKSVKKSFLITGHPGSGKSIYMHKLFQIFSGLDKNNLEDIRKIFQRNNAMPMLINLKDCVFETLENIIRNRQNDYKVRKNNIGFIYLLDGLDELSTEKADNILSYLHNLANDNNTKKIVISCRSGNLNKIKAKTYFTDIIEYKIDNLTINHINKYFKGKNNSNKARLLKKMLNKSLLSEIKDILLIKLFWDTIEKLNQDSTIIDLLHEKIELLVNEPKYAKTIEELNLLNPKEKQIMELNNEISFYFQNKSQFNLSQKDIQKIILNKYPRMDYESTNKVLNYIATLFFDNNTTFVYQHRKYQDFFFIQHLAKLYEDNPKVLREYNILSNNDFFENLFLPYLRKEYIKNKNLPGIIEINLIEVYLGNHSGWGANEAYYKNSEFTQSLAMQSNDFLQELLNNDSLSISEKLFLDLNKISDKFIEWEKDKNDYKLRNHLKNIFESDVSRLLETMAIFQKAGKQEITSRLWENLKYILELFKKYKFHENMQENERITDPFWNKLEDYFYLLINFKIEKSIDILAKIRQRNDNNEEIKSFFVAFINNGVNFFSEIIQNLNDNEILLLLDVLVSVENVHLLIKDNDISHGIKNKIAKINARNISLLFCKTIYNKNISTDEKDFLEKKLQAIQNKREMDINLYKLHITYAIISYILNKNSFEEYLNRQKSNEIKYYNELNLYTALFKDFIDILKGNKKIEFISRDYIKFINLCMRNYSEKWFKFDISSLWAYIFKYSNEETQNLLNIKNSLIMNRNYIYSFSFYLRLQNLDKNLFVKLVNKSDLLIHEKELDNWDDDYSSYVSRCFDLATIFADIDKQKVIEYIAKGINDGIIRHGWRKDYIISYSLVNALDILYRNNWLSREEFKKHIRTITELIIRLSKITDDRGISDLNNIIKLTSKYDIDLSIELKNEFKKKDFFYNSINSSVLSEKIKRGMPFNEIEEDMKDYEESYNYEGKPNSDYYEQKFKIYMEVALSNFYTETENKQAFENAYKQIEYMKNLKLEYYLNDHYFREIKQNFVNLCEKYKKEINITFSKIEEKEYDILNNFPQEISEEDFINDLNRAKTKIDITHIYEKLYNHNFIIILTKSESWNFLIEKTYSINKNIELFIELLRKNNFPHMEWSSNSKYFHFGLGYALGNINTKKEALNYLFGKNTGHDGFINVIKSYEVIEDKEMCIKLFERYLRFCDFLVN